jgi:hypothetical protein
MGTVVNLVNDGFSIDTSKDNVVIVDILDAITGGVALDVTGFGPKIIKAGHVIIQETATGVYKPMPLATNDTVYGALPAGHTYAGINIHTMETKRPFAGVLIRGRVNPAAAPFVMTTILAAVKTALPLIDFRSDN